MITGFNTDIEHDGVVYHVQTEDKGLDTPLILSLVYSGGAILASKRARYEDLIASGYSDEALSERVTRQHKLICAAIHAGRIDDLKRMTTSIGVEASQVNQSPVEAPVQPPVEAPVQPPVEAPVQPPVEAPVKPQVKAPLKPPAKASVQPQVAAPVVDTVQPPARLEILRGNEEREALEEERRRVEAEAARLALEAEEGRKGSAVEEQEAFDPEETISRPRPVGIPPPPAERSYSVHDPRRQSVMGDFQASDDGLRITILGQQEFRSGETPTLKVMVGFRTGSHEQPIARAAVSVKVLGTAFRPQIYSGKTQSDGVAVVATQIPKFTTGRAAILIKAVAAGKETEVRRVILPG